MALNAGILAFSTNPYAEHRTIPGFLVIEWLCFVAAAILCLYLVYVLNQLGEHISGYWTAANKLAATFSELEPFVDPNDVVAARSADYHAPFPTFCSRLTIPVILFMGAQFAWASFVTWIVSPG